MVSESVCWGVVVWSEDGWLPIMLCDIVEHSKSRTGLSLYEAPAVSPSDNWYWAAVWEESPCGMSDGISAYLCEAACWATVYNVVVATAVYNYLLGTVEFSVVDSMAIWCSCEVSVSADVCSSDYPTTGDGELALSVECGSARVELIWTDGRLDPVGFEKTKVTVTVTVPPLIGLVVPERIAGLVFVGRVFGGGVWCPSSRSR